MYTFSDPHMREAQNCGWTMLKFFMMTFLLFLMASDMGLLKSSFVQDDNKNNSGLTWGNRLTARTYFRSPLRNHTILVHFHLSLLCHSPRGYNHYPSRQTQVIDSESPRAYDFRSMKKCSSRRIANHEDQEWSWKGICQGGDWSCYNSVRLG